MKVAVIGSRTFNDYDKVEEILNQYNITEIISGGAKGADSLGKQYALNNDILVTIFKPDWKRYGRGAGFVRNKYIIDRADIVIAFWDGTSKGTKHSINLAKKQGKEVIIIQG